MHFKFNIISYLLQAQSSLMKPLSYCTRWFLSFQGYRTTGVRLVASLSNLLIYRILMTVIPDHQPAHPLEATEAHSAPCPWRDVS